MEIVEDAGCRRSLPSVFSVWMLRDHIPCEADDAAGYLLSAIALGMKDVIAIT